MIYKSKKPTNFGIDIISVGNLTVGGSGKTPLITALANSYEDVAIILRGYGRKSKGILVVKDKTEILCNVLMSGDEAMIYAKKLQNAIVIVSEERTQAIKKAKEMGAKLIFLDDAYSKHGIKKLDFLIDVKSENNSCLPAGPYRERIWRGKECEVLKEGVDFNRVVTLKGKCDKMSLVTAIARPKRLDIYLPELQSKHYFEDHYSFSKEELEEILDKEQVQALLVTYKDFVKIEGYNLPLCLLDLDMEVDARVFALIKSYREKN